MAFGDVDGAGDWIEVWAVTAFRPDHALQGVAAFRPGVAVQAGIEQRISGPTMAPPATLSSHPGKAMERGLLQKPR